MAGKFSRWFDTERPPKREASLRLSPLQQSILHWLRNELRRRQRAGDAGMVPYPDLVRALTADKASITSEARPFRAETPQGTVGMAKGPRKFGWPTAVKSIQ